MHYPRATLIIVVLLCLMTSLAQAALEATVDRTEMAVGETFQLSIRVDAVKIFERPDLAPLETDFDILGTSQNSSTRLINGTFTSTTNWIITLAPKRPGKYSIPPISLGKQATDSLEIQVNQKAKAAPGTDSEGIALEAELSHNTVYVGAQALLTLRVSHTHSARFQFEEEPKHPDASIRQVNEVSFQEIRGGRRVRVTEYTFALFPRIAGELVLQPITLVADVLNQNPRSMFDPLFGKSERVYKRTPPLALNVIPPAEGISPSHWLPAEQLSLSARWSKDPQSLTVGDSITRTITIEAKGVTAAQLPPLPMSEITGLKVYPDQPTVTDVTSADGVTGRRVEKLAMVATRPGRFELPGHTLQWWDVERNELRSAQLPSLSFNVAAAATVGSPSEQPGEEAVPATITAPPRPWYSFPLWWLVTALLSTVCIMLAWLYRGARRRAHNEASAGMAAAPTQDTERQAFQRLQSACAGHKSQPVYRALMQWWECFFSATLPGPADALASDADQELLMQALALQRCLFGEGTEDDWDPIALLAAVSRQRQAAAPRRASGDNALPALYPADAS